MTKNILAIAVVVALSACSSGSSNNNSNQTDNSGQASNDGGTTTGGTTTGGTTVTSPGGGAGPVTATKAGSYTGTIGGTTGNGVFVINNTFDIAGLAINADGSALSVFGNLGSSDTFTGGLRQYSHQESRSDTGGPAGVNGSFGAVGGRGGNDLAIDVTIVNGQTIESTAESATSVMLTGTVGSSVLTASAAALAGSWQGVHSFCDDAGTNCSLLTTTMNFSGTDVTGSTVVNSGSPVLINGSITAFGDAALIDFTWGDAPLYSGVVFFNPDDSSKLVVIGENQTNDTPTIAAVMSAQ